MNQQRKFLFCTVWATKHFARVHESASRYQGSQLKVSQELFSEKLTKLLLLGTTIWSTPLELWHPTKTTLVQCGVLHETVDHWTMPCIKSELFHCFKHHALHYISFSGIIALPIRYCMHLCGILQTHGLPHQ